ncbi:MAG: hypothetical protein K9N47_10890 [Prosthecobacter sp.]|nr:hypothetical protein [Prosthecobacter sp.]
MKHLVLRQLDFEITLCGGERVAESEIGDAINKHAEFHYDVAGGNLFVQHTGLNTGGDPCWQRGRIETKFFNAVTT